MCLPWSISTVMTHNLAQNAFLIYTGFSASNGGHFSVYSTTFLPFFERKFDAYLRQICLFDAYLRRSGGFMCQMTLAVHRQDGHPGVRAPCLRKENPLAIGRPSDEACAAFVRQAVKRVCQFARWPSGQQESAGMKYVVTQEKRISSERSRRGLDSS